MIINSSLTGSFRNTTTLQSVWVLVLINRGRSKVMEALTGAVLKDRVKDKIGPFGFNKGGKKE